MNQANVFDRIDILIGNQDLTGRPIEFVLDGDGNPIEATVFETTCPSCGAAVSFCLSDIQEVDGKSFVSCSLCGAGKDSVIPQDSLVVANVGQTAAEPPPAPVERGCPFIDPIELGTFKV